MKLLDMRTVIIIYVLIQLVSTLVIVLLWRQIRKRFAGTSYWVINYALQTTGLFLIALRGVIPDWISIDLSNLLVMIGSLLGLIALEKFVERRTNQIYNYLLVLTFIALHVWFTFILPDLALRTLNSSVFFTLIWFQCAGLLLYRVSNEIRKFTRGVGIVFGLYCLVNLLRIVDFFVSDHKSNDYFHSTEFEAMVLVAYQMLFVLLTYHLSLMFNKRLLSDIAAEEEKFSKAFYSSPFAITLTRLSDGEVFEVNDSFLKITGYERSDVIGKTSKEHHVWYREQDREIIIEELKKHEKVSEREFQFRIKSGEAITCIYSAEIVTIKNEKCILSSLNNITERKLAEKQLYETSEYLENLFNYANAPIIAWDTDYRITKFNHAFETLTGRSFDEVVGQKLDLLFPVQTKDQSLSHIYQTSKGERWDVVEIEIQNVNGEIKTVIWNSANIFDSDKVKIIATIAQGHDITKRKKAEDEIQKLNQELEQQVQRRTAELSKTITELELQSKTFVGRELRMIELKKQIEEMERKIGF